MIGRSWNHMTVLFVHVTVKPGKVKEYSYQIPKYAKRKLRRSLKGRKRAYLCTHDHIQHLKPENTLQKMIKEFLFPVMTSTLMKTGVRHA